MDNTGIHMGQLHYPQSRLNPPYNPAPLYLYSKLILFYKQKTHEGGAYINYNKIISISSNFFI